jgi:hypothetical protein
MAPRYWVGGTADWNNVAGLKWATTSGGPGGASDPTTADDVFFDAASTGTVTIALGNAGAKSINCTGFTGTLTGTTAITVAGSVTLSAGMTYTHSGTMTFTGTGTLTTAGKAFSNITINGAGITLTLGDALLATSRVIDVTQGTFDTANYSVTAASLTSNNVNTRTINLGSSTLSFSGNNSPFPIVFNITPSLTLNAGTSSLNLTGSSAILQGGNKTFNNVSFTSAAAGNRSILSNNTFNNLLLNASNSTGLSQLSLAGDQTVNGTFTCAGTSAFSRGFVRSDTLGTARTITAAAISANDCDFRDITLAGAAAGAAPTRAGDCGGNSGIIFPAAKNVFRVGGNTTFTGTNSWALTSGGAGSDNNFPLAQDTYVLDNGATPSTSLAVTGSTYNLGSFDCSNRTNAITILYTTNSTWHGSHTYSSSVTVSGSALQTFSGRGTMVFTCAGKTVPFSIGINGPSGTFRLGDAFNSSGSVTLVRGTFDADNYNVTIASFSATGSNTRTITMGSGLWTLTGTGTVWTTASVINLTFNRGTANILLSNGSLSSINFAGGALTFNRLTIGGGSNTALVTINSASPAASSFSELASTRTVSYTLSLGLSSPAVIGTWSITGSIGNAVTINSTSAGTRRTFTLTNVTSGINYLDVRDIGELSGNKFYVGPNSIDSGNNSNVYFTAPPSPGAATGNMLMLF